MTASPPETLPRFPGYRTVAELGGGTHAIVVAAEREPLGRLVAIKALRATSNRDARGSQELANEATVLSAVSHPGVIALYDYVTSATSPYLVLEHVDGANLQTVLSKGRRLAPEVVATVGAFLLRALAHVHATGWVHRDVKPANVLVSKEGDVKLVDFGIARPRPGDASANGRPVVETGFGTPAYMSPEQILDDEVDGRSDVFSVAVVLYELLAGVRPFDREDGRDQRALSQRIRRDPALSLRVRVPNVPERLDRIVLRALEKSPVDRFDSGDAMASALEGFVRDLGFSPDRWLARQALVSSGLVKPDARDTDGVPARPKRRANLARRLAPFAVLLVFALVGGSVIQWRARRTHATSRAGDAPLPLVPKHAATLRVLAEPWAEVHVDGEFVDTTPFARTIPLEPGKHFVVLRHPTLPPVSRVLVVNEGESALVDVDMANDGRRP
ncbi:MAG: serine/threonine-protein kinase [Polyangiaceae bacterium]